MRHILENILRKLAAFASWLWSCRCKHHYKEHRPWRATSIGARAQTSVFGFVCIKDFTSIVACLEEDMTRYVNAIAAINHRGVHHGFGDKNKILALPSSLLGKYAMDFHLRSSAQEFLRSSTLKAQARSAGGWPHEIVDNAIASFIRARVDVFNGNSMGNLQISSTIQRLQHCMARTLRFSSALACMWDGP